MSPRMHTWASVLILVALGCGQNDLTQNVTPAPPTTDDLIIADCYEIQAALEAYAAEHDGLFPGGYMDTDVNVMQADLLRPNRYTGLMTEPRLLGQDRRWPGQIGVTLFQGLSEQGYEPTGSTEVHGYRITGRGAHDVIITLENTASVSPDALDAYDTLWQSANLVAAALEQYAAESGWYPPSASHENSLGNSMIDFLPGGTLLMNPLNGVGDSPTDGSAGAPGQIGYQVADFSFGGGVWGDYLVDVRGPDGVSCILSFGAFSWEDAGTRRSLYLVQRAVEAFKTAGGHYPHDVDMDETPAGDTILDLLPGYAPTPTNVYTGEPGLPLNGLATTPGDIGYLPIEDNGEVLGYVINGFGIVEEFYRIEVLP
jgi:hypothetical protein